MLTKLCMATIYGHQSQEAGDIEHRHATADERGIEGDRDISEHKEVADVEVGVKQGVSGPAAAGRVSEVVEIGWRRNLRVN